MNEDNTEHEDDVVTVSGDQLHWLMLEDRNKGSGKITRWWRGATDASSKVMYLIEQEDTDEFYYVGVYECKHEDRVEFVKLINAKAWAEIHLKKQPRVLEEYRPDDSRPEDPGNLHTAAQLTKTVPKPEGNSSCLPDSGARSAFVTGAVRDAAPGKGWPHMIPPEALKRIALRFEQGGTKYGPTNWMEGIPLSRYYSAMFRHLMDWMEGLTDEDHLAAVGWNYSTAVWTEQEIYAGRLPMELMDMPHRITQVPEMQAYLQKVASKEGVVVNEKEGSKDSDSGRGEVPG